MLVEQRGETQEGAGMAGMVTSKLEELVCMTEEPPEEEKTTGTHRDSWRDDLGFRLLVF